MESSGGKATLATAHMWSKQICTLHCTNVSLLFELCLLLLRLMYFFVFSIYNFFSQWQFNLEQKRWIMDRLATKKHNLSNIMAIYFFFWDIFIPITSNVRYVANTTLCEWSIQMLHSDPMSPRRNITLICKYLAGPIEVIFVAGGWLLPLVIQWIRALNLTDVDIIQSRVSFSQRCPIHVPCRTSTCTK